MSAPPFRVGRPSPHVVAALIASAGALVLVVQWTHGRTMWLDEEMIAINLRDRSSRELAGPLWLAQAAPYGWMVLQRLVLVVFGAGERALRFLPLAFGIGTLATAVWIGRRWMSPYGAAALAFACAIGQSLAFFPLELKHYSADACAALLLPALAVRALEPRDEATARRRIAAWWLVATIAQWLANGALFVAPGCAILIVFTMVRRAGWRSGAVALVPGFVWIAGFGLHYAITLGPARSNPFLVSYWREALPPAGSGVTATLAWLVGQLRPLAVNPGGTERAVIFWAATLAGFITARRYSPIFRLAFVSVPISAFVLAAAHLVPLSGRLSIWIVPATYVGIAMLFETALSSIVAGVRQRRWTAVAAGSAIAAPLIALAADMYVNGTLYMHLREPPANHELDDRAAVQWLARRRQPGDVWITTLNALPAVWWYAGAADRERIGEASVRPDPSECSRDEIASWLTAIGARRVLVYLGFGHNIPPHFDDALLGRLGALGSVTAYRRFSPLSHALVVDLSRPAPYAVTLSALAANRTELAPARPAGCIAVESARIE